MQQVKVNPAPESQDEAEKSKLNGGASSTYNPISMAQAKLKVNKKFKSIVATSVLFIVAVDILGSALVYPALPSLCAWAEGGPADTLIKEAKKQANYDSLPDAHKAAFDEGLDAVVQEYISPDAFKDPKPPVKFSLSMNLIMSVGMLGSAGGSLLFGKMSDKIGCKWPMLICVSMGLVGYIIIYASGKWVNNYYLFAFGLCWNNFFGNTMGIAVVYMRHLFEPGPDRDNYVGSVMGMGLIGGAIGGLVCMPFITNPKNGANYFGAVWVAIGLTVASVILCSIVMVPIPKESEEAKEKEKRRSQSMKEEAKEKTPILAKRILLITIIASALDSAGDEGTRMARGTIMTNVFPEWATIERQNYLLVGFIFVLLFALALLGALRKCFNLGIICTIGCVMTLATQLLLMIEWEAAPYLIIWHFGKLFGFLSTLGSGFIIQETAPKALVGEWSGRNDALTNVASAITPLIFSTIYDEVGNKRGQEMLAATSAISFLAICVYLPTIKMLPKPVKEMKKEEIQDISVYEEMSDVDFMNLPIEVQFEVERMLTEAGKPTRILSWGSYKEERPTLGNLQERAVKDFDFMQRLMLATLTDQNKMKEEQERYRKQIDLTPVVSRDHAKQEMGAWIADYFDDAGYDQWETQGQMYKAMLLNAFPPIDDLQGTKPDYTTMPLEQMEMHMTRFLAVMDEHLHGAKRRVKTGLSADSMMNLLGRR